jgi:hypothetical protein
VLRCGVYRGPDSRPQVDVADNVGQLGRTLPDTASPAIRDQEAVVPVFQGGEVAPDRYVARVHVQSHARRFDGSPGQHLNLVLWDAEQYRCAGGRVHRDTGL